MGGMFSENAAIKKNTIKVEFTSSAAEALASSTTVLREMLLMLKLVAQTESALVSPCHPYHSARSKQKILFL